MQIASGCICGRHLLEDDNDGTCLICGHGLPHAPSRLSVGRRPLPRDLGSVLRSGKRPSPHVFENVRA